jgi:uncharacterized membrane protein YoaK (UPF0700 family)
MALIIEAFLENPNVPEINQNQTAPVLLAIVGAFCGIAGTRFRGVLSLILAGLSLVLVLTAIVIYARGRERPSSSK